MGEPIFPIKQSAKEFKDFVTGANKNQQDVENEVVNTKNSLGYVEGYAEYISKNGGLVNQKGIPYRDEKITRDDSTAKPSTTPNQINKQINQFRNIFGYDGLTRISDSIEDPTFIIFDLHMDYSESPLFNNVGGFINQYADAMEELEERVPLYNEFIAMVSKIFPGDLNDHTGTKRHYINSIGGMDNLFKKIVNYPEDVLTFTLSEDITMISQYLAELYSNLVYSYDTHRYMIPDNLLRFNLTIFFRDAREMMSVDQDKTITMNDNISKFAYVLHDCQFDFFNSRSFGSDMQVAGYEAGATSTPSTLSFNINYKSFSKIMMPSLIDNSVLIDLRERDGLEDGNYDRFNNDYQSQFEYQTVVNDVKKENIFTRELNDARSVLVNKVQEEITVLNSKIQKGIADKLGINITLTKLNVYYDDPKQAINNISNLLEDFIDDAVDAAKSKIKIERDSDNKINIYYEKAGGTLLDELKALSPEGNIPRSSNVNADSELADGKIPDGENVHGESVYNEKYPDGDVHDDGVYNEKYPDGDTHDDGTYNEKLPSGSVQEEYDEDDAYNEKYPDGESVHEDGTYNEKEPSGNIQEEGTYNEKFPDGDVHEDGTYNEKEPEGDVHEDGTYNEKIPSGTVHDEGSYNEKEPEGDVHEDGTYNDKLPSGTVQEKGTYNEKLPEGDVHEDGTYNEKLPEGDVHEDGQYNIKFPDGDVYGKITHKDNKPSGNVYGKKKDDEEVEHKEPEGDVNEDGIYNEKFPKGNRYKKNRD